MNELQRVSVVIPVKNESSRLPNLFRNLRKLSLLPAEVIVVDAASNDDSAAIAQTNGAKVILGGGHPGHSRNLGANLASCPWIWFLDADVDFGENTLDSILSQINQRELDVASTWFLPENSEFLLKVTHVTVSAYFYVGQHVGLARGIGGCLLVKRELHRAINGFRTDLTVGEDLDYIRRAASIGRYAFLQKPKVTISTRRFEKVGWRRIAFGWIGVELKSFFGKVSRWDYFQD